MLYMKGMVIRKLSPPPPPKQPPEDCPQQIPSWVRVGAWVRVRVGSNLPRGSIFQGAISQLPKGICFFIQ